MESPSGILADLMLAAGCGGAPPAGLSDDLGMPAADSGVEASSAASTTDADSGAALDARSELLSKGSAHAFQ